MARRADEEEQPSRSRNPLRLASSRKVLLNVCGNTYNTEGRSSTVMSACNATSGTSERTTPIAGFSLTLSSFVAVL